MATVRLLVESVPRDRIVFGENYPFGEGGKRRLLEEVRESGLLDEEELERVVERNAAFLFGLEGWKDGRSGKREGFQGPVGSDGL